MSTQLFARYTATLALDLLSAAYGCVIAAHDLLNLSVRTRAIINKYALPLFKGPHRRLLLQGGRRRRCSDEKRER